MKGKAEMSGDDDFLLSDHLGCQCKHVAAEFFLRFEQGIYLIRCSAVGRFHVQCKKSVVDAVRGGLTITNIEIGLCDSAVLHQFAPP